MNDPDVFIIDAYNHSVYPGDWDAAKAISIDLEIYATMRDKEFLSMIDNALKQGIDHFKPEFLIYNAGTDILEGDPLGRLGITQQGIIDRDEIVFGHCLKHGVKKEEYFKFSSS